MTGLPSAWNVTVSLIFIQRADVRLLLISSSLTTRIACVYMHLPVGTDAAECT